jgi:hypothetical protein
VGGAKSCPERRGEQGQAGGGAHHRKARQLQADRSGRRPFADDDIKGKIFHGRVQHFFHRAPQAMHLVDEQNVARSAGW